MVHPSVVNLQLQLKLNLSFKASMISLYICIYLQYFQIFGPQLVVKIGNVRWYEPPSFLHPVTVCPTSTHWAVPVKCMCSTVYKLQSNSKFRSGWTILSMIMGNHRYIINPLGDFLCRFCQSYELNSIKFFISLENV